MDIPNSFRPKNNLEKETQRLLEDKPQTLPDCYIDNKKLFFKNTSFELLKKLVALEDKIDHVKIDFKYEEFDYQLVYTHSNCEESLLQVIQKPCLPFNMSIPMLQDLAEKVMEGFRIDVSSHPLSSTPKGLMLDFFLEEESYSIRDLEQFFDRNKSFKNTEIYVEYHNLTKDDIKDIGFIPKKQILEKIPTYDFRLD